MLFESTSYARMVGYSSNLTVVLLLFLIPLMIGCSAGQFSNYAPKPFNQYPYSQIQDGLAVAIHPILTPDESQEYFWTDLLSANILAVFVMVDNTSSSSKFVLLRDRISLEETNHGVSAASHDASVGSADAARSVLAVSALSVISPVLIPLIFVGAQMETNAFEIKHNFIVKELQSTTLPPNTNTNGFVYFKLPENDIHSRQFFIKIEILHQDSKDTSSFIIPFQMGEE